MRRDRDGWRGAAGDFAEEPGDRTVQRVETEDREQHDWRIQCDADDGEDQQEHHPKWDATVGARTLEGRVKKSREHQQSHYSGERQRNEADRFAGGDAVVDARPDEGGHQRSGGGRC